MIVLKETLDNDWISICVNKKLGNGTVAMGKFSRQSRKEQLNYLNSIYTTIYTDWFQ